MKVTMNMAKSMVLALSNGVTAPPTLENFSIITFMVKVFIHGLMEENTKENGRSTRCMAKELSRGQMEGSISVST